MGVEPTSQAWEAHILPMYYARIHDRFSRVYLLFRVNKHHFVSVIYCRLPKTKFFKTITFITQTNSHKPLTLEYLVVLQLVPKLCLQ